MGPKQSSSSPQKKQKLQQEMIDLTKEQLPNQPLKKAFIVVGKMGHGKSSFINTLILPKDQSRTQITDDMKKTLLGTGAGIQSVTTECSLVEVHESHNIFQEKLYAIDTPGIDSRDAMCLVAEQIDDIILQRNCQIVGIAFVINLSAGRQVTQTQTSSMSQFMKLLKIQKKIKNELLFFILSNWDVTLFKWSNQQISQCLGQFNKLVSKIGVEDSQLKIIKWTNPICIKQKNFDHFVNSLGGKEIITQQWVKIRKIIQTCKNSSITPSNHEKNVNKFWESTIDQILSEIKSNNVRYKKEPEKISYILERKVKFEKKLDKKDKILFFKQVVPGLLLEAVGIATLQFGVGFFLISAGVYLQTRGTSGLIRKVLRNRQKIQQKPRQNENEQQFYNRQIRQKFILAITSRLKLQIIFKMQQQIEICDDKIVFKAMKDNHKIRNLQAYYMYEERKIQICQINTQQLQKQNKIQIKLLNQKMVEQKEDSIPKKDLADKQGGMLPIPESKNLYINNPQNLLRVGFDFYCFLPEEQNYYKIIERQCARMFGEYK